MKMRHHIPFVMALPRNLVVLSAFALAVLVAASSISFGQDDQTPFQLGLTALKARDYDTAITDFTQTIETNPTDKQAYFQRGYAYMEKADDPHALADLTKAIQLDPVFVQAYFRRAFVYMADANYDPALAGLSQAIQINPKFDKAYFRRAYVYMIQSKFDLALADINQVIALNPGFEKAYIRRSVINLMKGDYPQALADINEIIQQDPQAAGSYNRLAWLLAVCPDASVRNGPKAVENATKACDLTQWKIPAFIDTLAAADATAGDFAGAVKWESEYLASPNIDPDHVAAAQSRLALYRSDQPYHVDKFTPQLEIVF